MWKFTQVADKWSFKSQNRQTEKKKKNKKEMRSTTNEKKIIMHKTKGLRQLMIAKISHNKWGFEIQGVQHLNRDGTYQESIYCC